MRAVADTNVLVSGLLFGGLPRTFLNQATAQSFTLVTSVELLEGLGETLANKFHFDGTDTRLFLERIRQIAEIARPNFRLHSVPDDEDDNRVLECAVAGNAEFIVSGDKHLLRLGAHAGIIIVTVRQFIQTAGFRVD
jgi:putative PIN family toxin of toxin-antitoxin system